MGRVVLRFAFGPVEAEDLVSFGEPESRHLSAGRNWLVGTRIEMMQEFYD